LDKLKNMRIWFCWNFEMRKGKKTKVPYSARGKPTGTSPDHADQWVTYREAAAAAKEKALSGVGFVLPEGYVLIDIDDKPLDDPLVKTMLARCESYTERSVRGKGIHIICKVDIGQMPTERDPKGRLKIRREFYIKNSKLDLEIYVGGLTNRFATYSGNVIRDLEVTDCTKGVLTTFDKNMRRTTKQRYSEKRDGGTDEDKADFDLICSLRKQKNGHKFIRLFDQGDFSDYGSQSEADAALCAMLAFRLGNDPEAIDRLFRQSALYREKWERDDYRADTIQCGIDACHGQFHKSVMNHPEFIRFTEKGAVVSIPLLAEHVRRTMHYILVRDNGKQGIRLYVYKHGVYLLYSQDMMLGEIKQFIADYDPEIVRMSDVSGAYQHIMTDLCYVSESALNADEDIINFQNGLLRITEDRLTLEPHSPEVYSTIQIPCDWIGQESKTPEFDRYLDTLTDGKKDVQFLLYEWIGTVLSNIPGFRGKKSLFMVGKGDTGKSQIKALVERMLGPGNFIGIDLKEIEARFGTGALYGTRLAGSSDMSFLSVDELKTFKKLTGGDSVFAEFKGQQPFEFTYKGYLWFCMNRLPKFGGDDGKWVYDRIIVVKCLNVIPKEKQDKKLLGRLYAERAGIIYKAVKALQRYIADGYRYQEPQEVINAREAYQEENSTVMNFFNECMCRRDPAAPADTCTTTKIYRVYRAWCKDNNNGYAKTAKEFRDILSEHLGSTYADLTVHKKCGACYKDYTLNEECKQLYVGDYGTDFLV